jgi:hypothetical protein
MWMGAALVFLRCSLNVGTLPYVVRYVTSRGDIARAWGRLTATRRGRLELTAVGVAAVLLIGVAFEVPPAIADAHKLPGTAVPDDELAAVVAAATSCPTLTAPRIAAQLMALTGFTTSATGPKIAGMTDTDWTHWKPSTTAERDDTGDNITALAHETCQMVGQLRAAGLDGDLWGPAIAAQHGGIDAVLAAKGVPDGQKTFVDNAIGYAAWYADQSQFDPNAATPAPSPSAAASVDTDAALTTAVTVPAELVSAINRSGGLCPEVTPVRIAAQLRAVSNFDANLRTDQGEGIAQFSPELWAQYAGKSDSVWDAEDAIAVLGETMCDLTGQFSGFTGADPYTLALGAFQWGPNTIRQAAGLPATTVAQLADTVKAFEPTYQRDAQLNGNTAAKPSASPSASASASASPSAPASPSPSASLSPSPQAPQAPPATSSPQPKLYDASKTYQLQDGWAGAILELPGDNVSTLPSGTRVQLWTDLHAPDQYWRIAAAPAGGYVTITNNFLNKSLAVENDSTSNQSKLVVEDKNPTDTNQQWKLSDAGDGKVWITNHHSGKVIDLLGDDIAAPNSDGTWNGYLVEQWDKQSYAKDQRWLLVAS